MQQRRWLEIALLTSAFATLSMQPHAKTNCKRGIMFAVVLLVFNALTIQSNTYQQIDIEERRLFLKGTIKFLVSCHSVNLYTVKTKVMITLRSVTNIEDWMLKPFSSGAYERGIQGSRVRKYGRKIIWTTIIIVVNHLGGAAIWVIMSSSWTSSRSGITGISDGKK